VVRYGGLAKESITSDEQLEALELGFFGSRREKNILTNVIVVCEEAVMCIFFVCSNSSVCLSVFDTN
jgi:hypothetical protein